MRAVARLTTAAVAVIVLPTDNASAQVTYYTQGYFTTMPTVATCDAAAPLLGAPQNASCTGGGFMLNYTAVAQKSGRDCK